MPAFTPEEVGALKKFRKQVEDVLPKDEFRQRDVYLIRWLRARDMNLDKAEDMLRHSLRWREENNADKFLDNGIDPELAEKFPYQFDGVDKLGRPVFTMEYGKWDIKSFVESDPKGIERFLKHFIEFFESCDRQIQRLTLKNEKYPEEHCIQFFVIVDLTGFSFRQLTNLRAVQAVLKAVCVLEGHYPETLGNCYGVNVPSAFSILFGFIKPLITGRTFGKIRLFDSNKEVWQPEVLELVDASQIREGFGGSKKAS